MESDPEQAIEHDIAELDERIERLEDSVAEAKDSAGTEALAGEDPVGAHEE